MARLPKVGGDNGDWGGILNDYLSQSHDDSGKLKNNTVGAPQLKPNSVTSAAIADGQVTGAKIADGSVNSAKIQGAGEANGIATLDSSGIVPEQQLPQRLAESELNEAISRGQSPISSLSGLVTRLRAGQSAAFSIHGDSTGDSDGSNAAQDRIAARFARRLAGAFPRHHVMMKLWNPTTEDFGAWVVMQAQPAGRRYANITTRSLRYFGLGGVAAQFSGSVIDVRALVAAESWTPTTAGTIVQRGRKGISSFTNDLQFRFRIKPGGVLSCNWSTDGSTWSSDRDATAPVSVANGSPVWLRALINTNNGTGYEVKFFTSADGITWIQLGATLSAPFPATVRTAADDAFFEIGASNWNSTGDRLAGRFFEVQIRDGEDGPLLAPAAVEEWERYGDAATTFGGEPTLYVINASRSGSNLDYHTDATRLKRMTPNYGQVAIVINDGHNEGGRTGSRWMQPLKGWGDALLARLPNGSISVIGQNPHTSAWTNESLYGPEHVTRIMEASTLAARNGWGFINVYQAYLNDHRGVAELLSGDGLHPKTNAEAGGVDSGYALSGDTLAAAATVL